MMVVLGVGRIVAVSIGEGGSMAVNSIVEVGVGVKGEVVVAVGKGAELDSPLHEAMERNNTVPIRASAALPNFTEATSSLEGT